MGINQGIIRFTQGYTRRLTNSEQSRGYLFVSNDQKIKNNKELEVYLNGSKIQYKKIDKFGRIGVGKSVIDNAINKDIIFKLEGNKLYITY